MPAPIILSTWSFGALGNRAAWPSLASGGSSLDAVEAACRAVELDRDVDSVGVGGIPDRSGRVSLDGCVMLSPARCGSVACVRRYPHPVSIARRVMERTRHVMLVGDGAEAFAAEQGFETRELLTPEAFAKWEALRSGADGGLDVPLAPRNIEEMYRPGRARPGIAEDPARDADQAAGTGPAPDRESLPPNAGHDTVGVLALDAAGVLAGACSTSGQPLKLPGRVGDSPIIGHGLYVDPRAGAAVATGTGELVMGVCGGFLAVELMRRGAAPLDAVVETLERIVVAYRLHDDHQVAMIALTPRGQWAAAALRRGFRCAVKTHDRDELADPDRVLLE